LCPSLAAASRRSGPGLGWPIFPSCANAPKGVFVGALNVRRRALQRSRGKSAPTQPRATSTKGAPNKSPETAASLTFAEPPPSRAVSAAIPPPEASDNANVSDTRRRWGTLNVAILLSQASNSVASIPTLPPQLGAGIASPNRQRHKSPIVPPPLAATAARYLRINLLHIPPACLRPLESAPAIGRGFAPFHPIPISDSLLGRFGDRRLAAMQKEQTMCLHALAGDRNETLRYTAFLDNEAVTRTEMLVRTGQLTARRARWKTTRSGPPMTRNPAAGWTGWKPWATGWPRPRRGPRGRPL